MVRAVCGAGGSRVEIPRVRVLPRMGYLDADRTVTLKGRVACEIATGDELVGAEMIFAGVLTDVAPPAAGCGARA